MTADLIITAFWIGIAWSFRMTVRELRSATASHSEAVSAPEHD